MNNIKIRHALGLSVVAVLVTSAVPYATASAAPAPSVRSLAATSADGDVFDLDQYADGDITVQVIDSVKGAVDVKDVQDLTYSWSVTGFGAGAPMVLVPVAGNDVQPVDVKGTFVVPLPTAAGPGTYTLTAGLTPDVAPATAVPSTELLTVTAGNAAPSGSTAAITGLGKGTPGLAQDGTLTLTAPDTSPVEGQVYSLTVDHGFFTDGTSDQPPVTGAPAGDLRDLGTELTGVTDANGQIDFTVGIARDEDFDDDGAVTATVAVASTGPAATDSAAWSTSKTLNGRVAITVSPDDEQEGPVSPTLAGNKTYYDVFALDQFGNRVGGQSIELGLSGNLDDYNDSGDDSWVSDFTARGDIWVLSNEAGDIDITGTWEQAPTYTYVDTAGTTTAGSADATSTTTSSTYEIQFDASKFTVAPSVKDTVRVGTTVTHTVKVIDQEGNPVQGLRVEFLRFGPDNVRGDVRRRTVTDSTGRATYTFIGTALGRAKVTAVVSDEDGGQRSLTSATVFGAAISARLEKGNNGPGRDKLTVSTSARAAGARVQVYRVVAGKLTSATAGTLGANGTAKFSVRDRNGNQKTTYVAVVRSTSKTVADQSNTVKIR